MTRSNYPKVTEVKLNEWKTYLEKLFHESGSEVPSTDTNLEPDRLNEEVRHVLARLKNGKATGAEVLKITAEENDKGLELHQH